MSVGLGAVIAIVGLVLLVVPISINVKILATLEQIRDVLRKEREI
jgi:hypothetical protein